MDNILKNLNLEKLQNKLTSVKNKIILSEIEQMLEEATSNEHCHANLSLLNDIADRASGYADYQTIINHIEKTLQSEKHKWRRQLKTLFLVEHLLRVGNNRFVSSLNSFSNKIKDLTSFKYTDEKGDEKGGSIREKAGFIMDLLEDSEKLEEERRSYREWKNRIAGVSNNGSVGVSSVSSSSVNQSSYGGVSYNSYGNSKKKEKEKEKEKNRVGTNFNPESFKKTEIKRNNIDDSDEEEEEKKEKKKEKDDEDEDDDDDEFEVVEEKKTSNNKKIQLKSKVDEEVFCEVPEKKQNQIDFFGESKENKKNNKNNENIDFFSLASKNTTENNGNKANQIENQTNININDFQSMFISNNNPMVFQQYQQSQYNQYNNNMNVYGNYANLPLQTNVHPVQQEKIKLNYSSFNKKQDNEEASSSSNAQVKGSKQVGGMVFDSNFINLDDLGVGKRKN